MNVFSIHWKEETFTKAQTTPSGTKLGGGYRKKHGCTIVVADHIRQALDQFVDEYPDRSIDSAYTEGDNVLVNGEPV